MKTFKVTIHTERTIKESDVEDYYKHLIGCGYSEFQIRQLRKTGTVILTSNENDSNSVNITSIKEIK